QGLESVALLLEEGRDPERPALALQFRRRGGRLIRAVEIIEAQVEKPVFERAAGDEAVTRRIAMEVVVAAVEERHAETSRRHAAARRHRPDGAADLVRLRRSHFSLRVTLAVVDADVNLAVVARQARVERGARVRRRHDAVNLLALLEDRALEAIPVDAFHE